MINEVGTMKRNIPTIISSIQLGKFNMYNCKTYANNILVCNNIRGVFQNIITQREERKQNGWHLPEGQLS